MFSLDERVSMIKEMTESMPNVTVASFDGLLVDYMKEINATIIVRGLQAVTDFEYEASDCTDESCGESGSGDDFSHDEPAVFLSEFHHCEGVRILQATSPSSFRRDS